jgi:hypothetical protein
MVNVITQAIADARPYYTQSENRQINRELAERKADQKQTLVKIYDFHKNIICESEVLILWIGRSGPTVYDQLILH